MVAEQIQEQVKANNEFKIFDLYSMDGIQIKDVALRPHINLQGKLLLRSGTRKKFEKYASMKEHIVLRLARRVGVPGHVGKKHKIITNWAPGKYSKNMRSVLTALEIVAKRTGKNPVQVLVTAIENGSPRDEITVIEHAGARYPQAVDCSPMRRINLALRWMTQGAYQKAFGKKSKIAETLAKEIVSASEGNMESYAFGKKNESEKQADSAR